MRIVYFKCRDGGTGDRYKKVLGTRSTGDPKALAEQGRISQKVASGYKVV